MTEPTEQDRERAAAWARVYAGPMLANNAARNGYVHGQADERARIVAAIRARAESAAGEPGPPKSRWDDGWAFDWQLADAIESGEL